MTSGKNTSKKFEKSKCSICLCNFRYRKGNRSQLCDINVKDGCVILPCCNTKYHAECLEKWALRDNPTGDFTLFRPVNNRPLLLVGQENTNIFTCPCCRVSFTFNPYSSKIERVKAKVIIKCKGETLYYYISELDDLINIIPLSWFICLDSENQGFKLKPEYHEQFSNLINQIKDNTNSQALEIYALVSPDKEFILTTNGALAPSNILHNKKNKKEQQNRYKFAEFNKLPVLLE